MGTYVLTGGATGIGAAIKEKLGSNPVSLFLSISLSLSLSLFFYFCQSHYVNQYIYQSFFCL